VSIVLDIATISIVVASASAVVGVVYYLFDLRLQTKLRKTDLLVKLCEVRNNTDWLKAFDLINGSQTADLLRMRKENKMSEINRINGFFDEVGILLQMGLIDIDFVQKLLKEYPIKIWEKMKPVLEESRKIHDSSQVLSGFEYLYNEMKKRDQRK
jgi:hypothetical protein